jgi:3-oxoacyl-[acyl-carrier-protein] synthase II
MPLRRDICITGIGLVSPLGLGRECFWQALRAGRSGIGLMSSFEAGKLPTRLAAEVRDFNPLEHVKPRKSLKVMARDTQFGMTAASLARTDAGLGPTAVDPDRFGVVFAADTLNSPIADSEETFRRCMVDGVFHAELFGPSVMSAAYPLGMLKLLPNMLACHVSIAQDARSHNNTLYAGEVSSLLALGEAASVIDRGSADVMLVGGASSRMLPIDWARAYLTLELSHRDDDPAGAMRPFDARRDGQVRGEGGAGLMLEEARHAQRRGARIWARVLGWGSSADLDQPGAGLARAIGQALTAAGIEPRHIGHINAHGLSSRASDALEARVLAEVLPGVAVTAPKSYFGNLNAAGGMLEAIASVIAIAEDFVPPTLNYTEPDPECPVPVVAGEGLRGAAPFALLVNRTAAGQAAAVVLGPPA